jgi:Tfp pilus assembly protein PilF
MQRTIYFALVLAVSAFGCATSPDRATLAKAEARRDLAALHLHRGQAEQAIREYRQAVAIFDGDAEAHFGLGEAYRRKDEFLLAEQHLLRAIELQPELLGARQNLGALYIQQERWEEAIREAEILLADPTFLFPARALVNLGWAQYQAGDLGGAEASLREAISIEPNNPVGHLNLGIVAYERGNLAASISELESVVRIVGKQPVEVFGPTEAEARFRLAEAHARLGQRDRAIEHLQAAIEKGGESDWGRRSRDFLRVLQ